MALFGNRGDEDDINAWYNRQIVKCRKCGLEISRDMEKCRNCGRKLDGVYDCNNTR